MVTIEKEGQLNIEERQRIAVAAEIVVLQDLCA